MKPWVYALYEYLGNIAKLLDNPKFHIELGLGILKPT